MPRGDNNRKLTDEQRAQIATCYTTPLPDGTWVGVTTIARTFGISKSLVQFVLARQGVRMRSPKESHANGKRCKPITNTPIGEPPVCRCGCGNTAPWNRAKNGWYASVPGHPRAQPKPPGPGKSMPGSRNPAWKGGVTPERQRLYRSWKRLRDEVWRRDNFHCQRCGSGKTGRRTLHAHHVVPWADSVRLRFESSNLVTLCGACHLWVHSKTNREREFLASG